MKYACPRCGHVHEKRRQCTQGNAYANNKATEARRLRNRQVWKRVKRMANERDHYLCVLCKVEGMFTSEGLETHHIVPINVSPELAYDIGNLVTLCRRHHEKVEKMPPGVARKFWETFRNPQCPATEDKFRKPGD